MRGTPRILLALALVASMAPLTAPAAVAAPARLLEDPSGDVAFSLAANGAGERVPLSSGGNTDAADLLSLDALETVDTLTFTIATLKLDQPGTSVIIDLDWRWEDANYRVRVVRADWNAVGGVWEDATLRVQDEDGGWSLVTDLDLAVDKAASTFSFSVPRVYIVSQDGHVPVRGAALEEVSVRSAFSFGQIRFGGRFEAQAEDLMAADGDGARLVFESGDRVTGHVHFDVADPVRVSNGGATTFVFEALLENDADFDDEVDLATGRLPDGWTARVDSPVRVPANGEKRVFVLVSVPFAHDHGGYSAFNLTAKSRNVPTAEAETTLGVLHTPVPQPAGHHPDLFLHAEAANQGIFGTLFPFTDGYMNTDGDHAKDAPEVSPNFFADGVGWYIPLGPALAMGLDFDLEKTGQLVGAVAGRGSGETTPVAELWYGKPGQRDFGRYDEAAADSVILLAEGKGSPIELDPSAPTPFAVEIVPTEDADYVAYEKDANVWLTLRFAGDAFSWCCFPPQTSPTLLVADFKLTLPLLEYHDRLSGASEVETGLKLAATGPVERAARPGTLVTYPFTLTNGASSAETFVLATAGTDADLGILAPEGEVTLGPGETRTVTLGVPVPPASVDGQVFEIIVLARSKVDPSDLGLVRTTTTVSTSAETADESDVLRQAQQSQRDSPGLGLLGALLAAGTAGALVARRRR